MISTKQHLTLLVTVSVFVLTVSMQVSGIEYGSQIERINYDNLIARIVELFTILFEDSVSGIKNGLNYLIEILELGEQQ